MPSSTRTTTSAGKHVTVCFFKIVKERDSASLGVRKAFESYRNATIDELWDSPDEIIENFQNENDQYIKKKN